MSSLQPSIARRVAHFALDGGAGEGQSWRAARPRGREHQNEKTCVRTRTCLGVSFFSFFLHTTCPLDAPAVGPALLQKRPSSFWGALCYVRLILLPPAASHPPACDTDAAPASSLLGVKKPQRFFLSLSCLPVSLLLLSLPPPSLSVSFVFFLQVSCPSLPPFPKHTLTKAGWSLLSSPPRNGVRSTGVINYFGAKRGEKMKRGVGRPTGRSVWSIALGVCMIVPLRDRTRFHNGFLHSAP